jgi:raffinose/stachyose/melibiose transport system permease protein
VKSALALVTRILVFVVFLLLSVVMLLPFLVMIFATLREPLDIVKRGAIALPEVWRFTTIRDVFTQYRFGLYLLNTIIVTVPTVAVALAMAILSAFALAVMDFRWKRPVIVLVTVIAVMISEEFIMIPLFQMQRFFGITNTFLAVILPQVAMSAAFATLIIRSFFLGLPREMADAAMEDGASSWQILWKIYVPLSGPPILTAATLTTTWTWNDYIIPLVMLSSTSKATLPLGLVLFRGAHTIDIPLTMAGTLVTALPMLLLFVIFQRNFVQGLTQGVLK